MPLLKKARITMALVSSIATNQPDEECLIAHGSGSLLRLHGVTPLVAFVEMLVLVIGVILCCMGGMAVRTIDRIPFRNQNKEMLLFWQCKIAHFVAIEENGFDTIANQVNSGRTHIYLILASIFIWFKAEPEFTLLAFSSRRIGGQGTVWPFPTEREEQFVDTTTKTDVEQQDIQSQMVATIEQADSVSMEC
jgi:hypothetical protein